ncbi:hypothetical protein [Acinetobacter guerrae]|uniref:hypothetical protein n=1 Tax=Acinetobacter guerrae TaxID=1843371 RepID=UPI001FD55CB5|nr:hypothetical protein [Acinetobacter guerrae]
MSQVRCPYCGSVQVKAMANQPKKYPRPINPEELARWQKGFDCKKCGNDFVVTPPKPLSFIAKLCGWILFLLICYFIYSALTNNKNEAKTYRDSSIQEASEQNKSNSESNPLDQVFSKESEEAAHAYIPPEVKKPHKSIENSNDQNDTLSISTTLRAKDD